MLLKVLFAFFCLAAVTRTTIVITNLLQTGFADNEIEYRYLNFGEIPYGKTLAFDLFIT